MSKTNEQMMQTEILPLIRGINKTLFASGNNLRDVTDLWRESLREAKMHEVMAMFYDGLTDSEIGKATGYSSNHISTITAKALDEKVTKHVVKRTEPNNQK